MDDNTEYSLDAPLSPAGRRRRGRLPVRVTAGLVRADRQQPGGHGPRCRACPHAWPPASPRASGTRSAAGSSCGSATRTHGPRCGSPRSDGSPSTRRPTVPLAGTAEATPGAGARDWRRSAGWCSSSSASLALVAGVIGATLATPAGRSGVAARAHRAGGAGPLGRGRRSRDRAPRRRGGTSAAAGGDPAGLRPGARGPARRPGAGTAGPSRRGVPLRTPGTRPRRRGGISTQRGVTARMAVHRDGPMGRVTQPAPLTARRWAHQTWPSGAGRRSPGAVAGTAIEGSGEGSSAHVTSVLPARSAQGFPAPAPAGRAAPPVSASSRC